MPQFKLTVLRASGKDEVVTVDTERSGITDEEVLEQIVAKWMHALTCQHEVHLMKFRSYPHGQLIIISPGAIDGFSLKTEVLQ